MHPFDHRKSIVAIVVVLAFLLFFGTTLLQGCSGTESSVPEEKEEPGTSFEELHDYVDSVAADAVVIAAGGDVNLGASITQYLRSYGVEYPWEQVAPYFQSADAGFVNLECCLSTAGSPVPGKEFCFRGPPEGAAGLHSAGVDVVSLANNHSKDYGTAALVETFSSLGAAGVQWCGAGNNSTEALMPAVAEVRGQRIAFVAFCGIVPSGWPATETEPGCATTWDREKVAGVISAAASENDYVVASFHWGVELDTSPNGSEVELAHLAVDSGADLVLGHHPHVVQGFELYKERLIAYSLGNYIFGPPREISAKTLTLVVLMTPEGLVQAKLVPMHISSCRPVLVTGSAAESWIATIAGYSKELGTDVVYRGGYGFIEGNCSIISVSEGLKP